MTKMNAGKYRHRVTIRQAPTDASRDGFGGRKGSGVIVAEVWAEKQDWSGSEVDEQGRETASVTTKWRIRHRTDVRPQMQLVYGNDVYDIQSVLDFDGKTVELILESRKVVV